MSLFLIIKATVFAAAVVSVIGFIACAMSIRQAGEYNRAGPGAMDDLFQRKAAEFGPLAVFYCGLYWGMVQ